MGPLDVAGQSDEGSLPVRGVGDAGAWLAFYDRALPQVYGYLVMRCGERAVAEDLTTDTWLALLEASQGESPKPLTVAYAIGVARHKLVDHWRTQARSERRLRSLEGDTGQTSPRDEADEVIDSHLARETLGALAPQHCAALTLRYVDDLAVPEVAALLGRSVHATEALLVRAKAAFRQAYPGGGGLTGGIDA